MDTINSNLSSKEEETQAPILNTKMTTIIKHINDHQQQQYDGKQKNTLQKMFLLTEPAFRQIKQEQDNEKRLSDLDHEMKKTLFDTKIPHYSKWIKYSRLLHRYMDFKRFIEESKTAKDESALEKFTNMQKNYAKYQEKKASRLSAHNLPKSTISISPTAADFQQTLKAKTPPPSVRRQLVFDDIASSPSTAAIGKVASPPPEDVFEISSRDSSFNKEMAMDIDSTAANRFLDDSATELQKHYENTIIAKQTLRQRLDALPPAVQAKFFHGDQYPVRIFRIAYIDEQTEEEHSHLVNGYETKIVDENVLRVYDKEHGFTSIHNIIPGSLASLRHFLIETHAQIDKELEKDFRNKPATHLKTRRYSLIDSGQPDTQGIRKGDIFLTVPHTLLDKVIEAMDEHDLSGQELLEFVSLLKDKQKKQQSHPLNRHYTLPSSAAVYYPEYPLPAPQTPAATGQVQIPPMISTSTPTAAAVAKSIRPTPVSRKSSKVKAKTPKQPSNKKRKAEHETIDKSFRVVKYARNPSLTAEDSMHSDVSMLWEKA